MNHLIHETSPYLLQHAHNPVEWYAWKPEAFERAKAEDKPILVSIGYSTCHWCHVMERESFENQDVADIMNQLFVCIKVDREERPDVDQIYMEACQIVSGSGGWPLNCFLLPDGRPYFAGTYYPPQSAYGRPSWVQVLHNLSNAYKHKRDVVEQQANQLTDIIRNSDKNYIKNNVEGKKTETVGLLKVESDTTSVFDKPYLENVFYALRERFDRIEGGFGGAPKFPSTMSIQFLMDYHFYTKNEEALAQAELSLIKMIQGGIYDQIGGGFARYATDREWLIPHFEKMLYDNALLITTLSDAYKLTKRDIYRETIEETLTFILRDMTAPDGGFYSAYDADSEGVEGKFYVWDKAEIGAALGEDAPLFCAFYDVSDEGNWEENNILWRSKSYSEFAQEHDLDVLVLKDKLRECREKLFEIREKRIKPGLDDKILLSWNALMISAFARAFEALGTVREDYFGEGYQKTAVDGLDFIFEKFKQKEGIGLYHTYKNGQAQYDGFLEDYAYLIEALLDVYGITFDKKYLEKAKLYTDFTIENFFDESSNLFYFTSEKQKDILLRKKDLYDSATPSGNSTMVRNLQRLGHIFDDKTYQSLSISMLLSVEEAVERYPSSLSKWAGSAFSVVFPPYEIAVVGADAQAKSQTINALFLPNKVLMSSVEEDAAYPLLTGRSGDTEGGQSLIYVCQNYACKMPVRTVEEMEKIL